MLEYRNNGFEDTDAPGKLQHLVGFCGILAQFHYLLHRLFNGAGMFSNQLCPQTVVIDTAWDFTMGA